MGYGCKRKKDRGSRKTARECVKERQDERWRGKKTKKRGEEGGKREMREKENKSKKKMR